MAEFVHCQVTIAVQIVLIKVAEQPELARKSWVHSALLVNLGAKIVFGDEAMLPYVEDGETLAHLLEGLRLNVAFHFLAHLSIFLRFLCGELF